MMVKEFGTMEKWKSGIMGKQLKPFNPIFHSSNIPIFRLRFHYSNLPYWRLK